MNFIRKTRTYPFESSCNNIYINTVALSMIVLTFKQICCSQLWNSLKQSIGELKSSQKLI